MFSPPDASANVLATIGFESGYHVQLLYNENTEKFSIRRKYEAHDIWFPTQFDHLERAFHAFHKEVKKAFFSLSLLHANKGPQFHLDTYQRNGIERSSGLNSLRSQKEAQLDP